jgi:glycosyltransferase involved in cell wall biosynthesis
MTQAPKRLLIMSENTLDTHYFQNVGKGLSATGFEILFASMKDPQAPRWMQDAGYQYFWLRANRRWHYPGAISRLSKIVRREKVDLLHAHLHEATFLGAAVKLLNRHLKYVAGRHYTDQLVLLRKPWHVSLDRWVTSVADVVTVPCDAAKDYMVANESANADKIVPTYLGFDFAQFKASAEGAARIRRELGLETDFVIGCVARFMRLKGHNHLLRAFTEIVRAIPSAKLLLVGGGDDSAVRQQANELGLESQVILAGHRADVADCMAAMDILVNPSTSESFCQVIIEAMGVGKPVITTRLGVAEEAITDGETGILISPGDSDAITHAVLRLHSDPALRQRMGEAGRRSVTQRFTLENMVRDHVRCYSQLCEHN